MPLTLHRKALFLFLLLCLTCLIYYPGLSGGFVFDDYANIVNNERLVIEELSLRNLHKAAFSSGQGGIQDRPVSMLTFAINIFSHGMEPFPMKVTNVLIHCMTGIAIFFFLQFLLLSLNAGKRENQKLTTNQQLMCLLTTGLWMVHPFNLTSVSYIVQRMTALSALFVYLGLAMYCYGRLQKGIKKTILILCALGIFGPLATLSKENGILIYAFVILYELFIYNSYEQWSLKNRRHLFCFILILLGFIGVVFIMLLKPEMLISGYNMRDFTLVERVLTQSRVLWYYIGQIFLPRNTEMSLYYDDMAISTSFLSPITTLLAVTTLCIVISGAIFLRNQRPLLSFLIIFYFTGHLLESTFIPLEMVFEHRNYLPSVSLILFFVIIVDQLLSRKHLERLKPYAAIILLVLFSINTAVRADQWGDSLLLPFFEVEKKPGSARANYEVARTYAMQSDYEKDKTLKELYGNEAKKYWKKSIDIDSDKAESYINLIILNSKNNLPFDPVLHRELERIINETQVTASATMSITGLFKCLSIEKCMMSDQYIDSLIKKCISSKKLSGLRRGIVLQSISNFLWIKRKEYESAIKIMNLAVLSKQSYGRFYIDLARMFLAVKNHESCAKVIDQLEAIDFQAAFREDIKAFRMESCVSAHDSR